MQSLLASEEHSEENRQSARAVVLAWANEKWPGLIPENAADGSSFEYDQAGLRIAAQTTPDGRIWAFRSEHIDREASRTWVTEALVSDNGKADVFGIRNLCSTLSVDRIDSSSPRFLNDLLQNSRLVDGTARVTPVPQMVTDDASFTQFCELLFADTRNLPVVVLTQQGDDGDYTLDPYRFAKSVRGLAHVFCLPFAWTFRLTERVGKRLSVFDGAVRTYYPGLTDADDAFKHPVAFVGRIEDWVGQDIVGTVGFAHFLTQQIHRFSVRMPETLQRMPSYFEIRKLALDKPHNSLEEQMEILRLDLELARQEATEWELLAKEADAEALAAKEDISILTAKNIALFAANQALRTSKNAAPVAFGETYSELPEWIDTNYGDRIVLHSRAKRALKDATFENVTLVYRCIKLIAEDYWEMRTFENETQRTAAKARWEAGLQSHALDFDNTSLSQSRLGEFREQYTIPYRIGQQQSQILGPHLKWGETKDDRFCMRIYFVWDDEREVAVIGHLTSHLDTRAS